MSVRTDPLSVPAPAGGVVDLLRTNRLGMLLGGNLLSAIGTFVHVTVTSWLLYQLTGSSAMVGLLTVAQYAPIVALTLPAGILADHRDRRRFLLEIEAAMMIAAGSLAALVWLGLVSPWTLIALTAVMGIGSAFGGPSWIAFVGDIAPDDRVLLAFSFNSVSFHLAAALGPLLGTVLLTTWGPGWAFFANALSFLAIMAGVAAVPSRRVDAGPFPGLRRSMADLYRFARVSQRARRLLPVSAAIAVVAFGLPAVLPAFATDVLGGSTGSYGSLMGALGAGSLTGAVMIGILQARVARRTIIVAGAWAVAAGAILLGVAGRMDAALAGMVGIGCGQLMLLVTSRTVIQMDAPEPLRARAVSLWFVFSVGVGPLGGLLLGWLADAVGVGQTIRLVAVYAPALALVLTVAARTRAGRILPYASSLH